MPPGTGRQARQANAADLDSNQASDRVTEGGHHPAHLTVAAFVDGQLHLSLPCPVQVLLAAQQADIFCRPGHAIVQHDAAPQPPERILVGNAGDSHPVSLRYVVARMSQLEQKVPIVREKDQAFTVGIQSPDRPKHRLTADVDQISHHLADMTVRVGARRDNPFWLIHR